MKLLQRYLSQTFLSTLGLVLLLLIGLHFFIALIGETHNVGKGDYTFFETVTYVMMSLPQQIYDFFPIATLLASLLGLGTLASHSELIAMQSVGVSIKQITATLLKTTLLLLVIVTLVGETLAPHLKHLADERKTFLKSGGQAFRTQRGVWLREGKWFIYLRDILPAGQLENLLLYEFDSQAQLKRTLSAKRAEQMDHQWKLYEVQETSLSEVATTAKSYLELILELKLSPELLKIVRIHPEDMSLVELYHYITETKRNGSQARHYELIFWQRVLQPLATCVMVLLAIPFIFGPLRSTTMGLRMVVGILIGFSFYLLNQFFGPLSIVYQLPPLLAALLPTALFAFVGYRLLRKI